MIEVLTFQSLIEKNHQSITNRSTLSLCIIKIVTRGPRDNLYTFLLICLVFSLKYVLLNHLSF